MRTTVRLDDALLERAKRHAAERGETLTTVIREALVAYLGRPAEDRDRQPFDLPVAGSGGLVPGADLDVTAQLHDTMDGIT
jgi:hypothetical protein